MQMLSKKIIALLVAIALVIIAFGGYVIWRYIDSRNIASDSGNKKADSKVVVSDVCGDDIAARVSPALASEDISATREVAEPILKLENYQGDVDCNYILTRYYIMTGQVDLASISLDAMIAARAAGSEYSLAFDPPVMPVASLRTALETTRSNQLEAEKNQVSADELNEVDKQWQE